MSDNGHYAFLLKWARKAAMGASMNTPMTITVYPAQQESFVTSLPKLWAASLRPSTVVSLENLTDTYEAVLDGYFSS